jgi:hypothetical protein
VNKSDSSSAVTLAIQALLRKKVNLTRTTQSKQRYKTSRLVRGDHPFNDGKR